MRSTKPDRPRLSRTRCGTRFDHVYALGGGRLIHTFPLILTEKPLRRSGAQVLITLHDKPFGLRVEDRAGRYGATAIKPLVARSCRADETVALSIYPSHPQYRRFRMIPANGLLVMERARFRPLDAALESAFNGTISIDSASRLADGILAITLSHLPESAPLDARVARVLDLLKANPQYPLPELAAAVDLSHYRLSHLFMEEMGISLRSYHLWRKVHVATKLLGEMTIAEAARRAGFTDASHLSRAFHQLHALPPSHYFGNRQVKIFARPRASASA